MSSGNAPAFSASLGGALLVSDDALTIKQISESLQQLAMSPEVCTEVSAALDLLNRRKFDAVIVDLHLGDQAKAVLQEMRRSPSNRTAVLFAISGSDEETASAFKGGSSFVLRRPLSFTSIDRILRVAYGLIVRERRRYFRCPVEMPVTISGSGMENSLGHAVNISEGGIAIQTSAAVKPEAHLRVQFVLPDEKPIFTVESTVCWSKEDYFGLQFASLSPQQTSELQEWLAHRLEESFPEFVAAKFRNLGHSAQGIDEPSAGTQLKTTDTGESSGESWVALYQAALLEPDAGKQAARIEVAERNMKERWRQLVSGCTDNPEERERLSVALEKLRGLTEHSRGGR